MTRVFVSIILLKLILLVSHYAPTCGLEYTAPSEKPNSTPTTNSTIINLLPGVHFALEHYKTWGHTIEVPELLLVAYPKSSEEVVSIVNWASKEGRKVRPRGYMHSFPPLTVTKDAVTSKVVLVDLRKHMNTFKTTTIPRELTVTNEPIKAVVAETGASWEDLMTFCDKNNMGLAHSIIIGDATVGGVLAIGGHGAAVPAQGEKTEPGFSFGSLSNLIASFKAVVWDPESQMYTLKTFLRSDPDSRPFLAHIGRAFLTEVTLIVGDNYNLRCKSITDIPADELFADPDTNPNTTRTFASFLDSTGRADVQWYQFTKNPWLKVWNVEKEKPISSFEVTQPYNFQFPVNVKMPSKSVPELGEIAYNNILAGLKSTNSSDMWGTSKNILLYSNGSSQPIVYGGFVVLTSREKIQKVLSTVVQFYKNLNEEYASKSLYPIDYYIKFRVTGLDSGNETSLKNAQTPAISPLSPHEDYPNFNVALWMNTFTAKDNVLGNQFMKKFESFYFNRFNGTDGLARVEWSKSWAYSDNGSFTNATMLNDIIPSRYGSDWKLAKNTFDKYDPKHVFSNEFLDALFST